MIPNLEGHHFSRTSKINYSGIIMKHFDIFIFRICFFLLPVLMFKHWHQQLTMYLFIFYFFLSSLIVSFWQRKRTLRPSNSAGLVSPSKYQNQGSLQEVRGKKVGSHRCSPILQRPRRNNKLQATERCINCSSWYWFWSVRCRTW